LARFTRTDLVDGKVEFSDDVKAVQNVQRTRAMQGGLKSKCNMLD
jgi:hypothetical protein